MTALLEKRCPKCGIVKDDNQFAKDRSKKSGLSSHCKQCKGIETKQYEINNPMMNQTNAMVRGARDRAKAKNLPFDIDHEYIRSIIPSRCPIFGVKLEWSARRGNKSAPLPNSPSLDRIDPTRGYVKGNVWIISHKANCIKSNASHEELKLVTEAVGRAIVNSLEW
jgi:hypothetical protein